ncbi:hypothetical protein GGX14DRAFT_569232 [Mycena pura]|uniref:Uncharacterized protein n=1 Tax=Mycena pura TaxID=153505 RepID=A0AAD6V7F4_9AGAR|nr:hypothetical protein GGX14DRAFT_569232 [Mycena pura]
MHFFLLPVLSLLVIPLRVFACEGECITGTTNQFILLMDSPVARAFETIGELIVNKYLNSDHERGTKLVSSKWLLEPVTSAYKNEAPSSLEYAIFPSYFHGKCQNPATGQEPKGCPNPNCPVVCGTPGSLVHFFSNLTGIVHYATMNTAMAAMDPHSASFRAVEKKVTTHLMRKAASRSSRLLRYRRSSVPDASSINRQDVRLGLMKIMDKFPKVLEQCCGGSGWPDCIWEDKMKKYILSFP